jgi:hypothetical protein
MRTWTKAVGGTLVGLGGLLGPRRSSAAPPSRGGWPGIDALLADARPVPSASVREDDLQRGDARQSLESTMFTQLRCAEFHGGGAP